ncbi:hypothetical protein BJ165DRAFT_1410467 [Panaeolus papilionaceus]|nr:hypothetical protein BJ165DRAFT_1410467 [Panaeolus papilionaceus]
MLFKQTPSGCRNTKIIISESDDSDDSVESDEDDSSEGGSDSSEELSSSNSDEESSSNEEESEEESAEESSNQSSAKAPPQKQPVAPKDKGGRPQDEESKIQSHHASAKAPPQKQLVAPKDKGGRPSAEKKAELEAAVSEIAAVVAKCAQRLNMAHDRMLDAVLDQEGRGANAWNIYQCYVVDNFDEEIIRLPEHDRVDSFNPGLRVFKELISFQMKEGAENWSFDSVFLACGRIVNQDQSLCELAYAGLAEDFFSKQLGIRESLIQGHFRTHVFYEESRSSAAHVKKKILTAKLLPSEQSECAEDNANEEETLQEESNPQAKQSDEKLRESLNNLLKKLNLKPSQTWKALPKYLAQKRYTIINWPRVVPLPFESRVSRKGIVGLGVDARKAWYAGLTSATNRLSLQPWGETVLTRVTATAADTPVIQLAPEGPKKPPILVFEDTSVVLNGVAVGRDTENQWTPLAATGSTSPLEKGKKRASADDPAKEGDELPPSGPGPKKRAKTADVTAQALSVIDKTPASNPTVLSTPNVTVPSAQAAAEDNAMLAKPKNKANKDDVAAVVRKNKTNKDEGVTVAVAHKKRANKYDKDADKTKKAKSKSSSKKDKDRGRKQGATRSNQTSDVEEEEKESGADWEQENRMEHPRDTRHVEMRAQESHGDVTGFKETDIAHNQFPQERRACDENTRGEAPPFSQRRESQTSVYETVHQRSDGGRSGNPFFPAIQSFPESSARSSTAPSESGFSMTSESSGHHQRHSSLAPSHSSLAPSEDEYEYPPRHRYRQQEPRSRNISPGLTGYGFNNANIPSISTGYNGPWSGPYDSQAQHPSRQHQYARQDARQDHFQDALVGPGMNVANSMSNLGNGVGTGMGSGMNVVNSMSNLGNNILGAGMGHVGMNMMTGIHNGGSGNLANGNVVGGSNNHFHAENAFDNLLDMGDQQGLREQHLPFRVHGDVFS